MKIVIVSDTHNQLSKVKIPKCDLLIHAGDHTMNGTLPEISEAAFDLRVLKENGVCKDIITIAGNHDFLFEKDPYIAEAIFSDLGYLRDKMTVYKGLKIYGTPWTPWFFDWAFNLERGSEIKRKWDLIPDGLDILITHGPPDEILDQPPSDKAGVGCEELALAIKRVKPRVHVFGHIHDSYGLELRDGILFINASTCNEAYNPENPPIVINYNEESKEFTYNRKGY